MEELKQVKTDYKFFMNKVNEATRKGRTVNITEIRKTQAKYKEDRALLIKVLDCIGAICVQNNLPQIDSGMAKMIASYT